MNNPCVFSADRVYRYTLLHSWRAMWEEPRRVVWIALNPSTADENQLDPTLRRIKGFSADWGFNEFMMLNAFAFRATDPREMEAAADPIGPENDKYILQECEKAELIVCAWGTHCALGARHEKLLAMLRPYPIHYLRLTSGGYPSHPLYLPKNLQPISF